MAYPAYWPADGTQPTGAYDGSVSPDGPLAGIGEEDRGGAPVGIWSWNGREPFLKTRADIRRGVPIPKDAATVHQ